MSDPIVPRIITPPYPSRHLKRKTNTAAAISFSPLYYWFYKMDYYVTHAHLLVLAVHVRPVN